MEKRCRVVWAADGSGVEIPSGLMMAEADYDLPNLRAFRVYGFVATDHDQESQESVVYIEAMSYWPTPLIVRDVTSMLEAEELTGMTVGTLGKLLMETVS